MNVAVELPDYGEEAGDHATVSEWHFEEGDLVLEDEVLLEVMTEHETHDIRNPATGILVERCVEEDDVVRVGDALAIIEVADESEEEIDVGEDFGFEEE